MCSVNTKSLGSIYQNYIMNNVYEVRHINYYPLLDRIIEWMDQHYGNGTQFQFNHISDKTVDLINSMATDHFYAWLAGATDS